MIDINLIPEITKKDNITSSNAVLNNLQLNNLLNLIPLHLTNLDF